LAQNDREDLAAMFAWVTRKLGDEEKPLLAASELTMWEYIVLSNLARGPAPNQLTLARAVRHDKTRLIKLLDDLQDRGMIDRTPDPADRRSHNVRITDKGRRVHATARAAIRKMEDEVLDVLTAAERRALLTALPKLYEAGGRETPPSRS
jgi:MarR family transcriptional regulator, organic hydroperoxide resistance regulator